MTSLWPSDTSSKLSTLLIICGFLAGMPQPEFEAACSTAQTAPGSERRVSPKTVCEILGDLTLHNGQEVLLIGRLRSTEEGTWVSADDCPKKLTTGDFVWPNSIWLSYDPSEQPQDVMFDSAAVDEALLKAKATTKVRGGYDRWAVVYGLLQTRDPLTTVVSADGKTVWGYGFGHLNAAPAQLVYRRTNRKVLE